MKFVDDTEIVQMLLFKNIPEKNIHMEKAFIEKVFEKSVPSKYVEVWINKCRCELNLILYYCSCKNKRNIETKQTNSSGLVTLRKIRAT